MDPKEQQGQDDARIQPEKDRDEDRDLYAKSDIRSVKKVGGG